MDVKAAAKEAKAYVKDLFNEEIVSRVQLEEVDFDDSKNVWVITVGFWRRPSRDTSDPTAALSRIIGPHSERSFKTVCIRDLDGKVLSVKHRWVPNAE